MHLWVQQVAALKQAVLCHGLFAAVSVGSGKTLICALIGEVLGCKTVVLCPAGLVPEAERELEKYRKHFKIGDVQWLSYGILSHPNSASILEEIGPELICADECQMLKNPKAARTRRFLSYMDKHPGTLFAALSGTITKRSLKDYGHLADLALRNRSFMPRKYAGVTEWAEALDAQPIRRVGALLRLASPRDVAAYSRLEAARRGYRCRMVETPGVVSSDESSCDIPLFVRWRDVHPSPAIARAFLQLQRTWTRPDGEQLIEALDFDRARREILIGGYHRWVWPNGDPNTAWLAARAQYHRLLRRWLDRRARDGLDSSALVERQLEADWRELRDQALYGAWLVWREYKHIPPPPTEWVWICRSVLDSCLAWADEVRRGGIIWTQCVGFAQELARASGGAVPYFGQGRDAARKIHDETGDLCIAASIKAHGTGRNLQDFNKSLVVGGLSADVTEQLIGRTRRPGQTATSIEVTFLTRFREDYRRMLEEAKYIEHTLGNKQAVLHARDEGET